MNDAAYRRDHVPVLFAQPNVSRKGVLTPEKFGGWGKHIRLGIGYRRVHPGQRSETILNFLQSGEVQKIGKLKFI